MIRVTGALKEGLTRFLLHSSPLLCNGWTDRWSSSRLYARSRFSRAYSFESSSPRTRVMYNHCHNGIQLLSPFVTGNSTLSLNFAISDGFHVYTVAGHGTFNFHWHSFFVYHRQDYVSQTWKNGLGQTSEISIYPPGKDFKTETFFWRLSKHVIDSSCNFSLFPEYEWYGCWAPKFMRSLNKYT